MAQLMIDFALLYVRKVLTHFEEKLYYVKNQSRLLGHTVEIDNLIYNYKHSLNYAELLLQYVRLFYKYILYSTVGKGQDFLDI